MLKRDSFSFNTISLVSVFFWWIFIADAILNGDDEEPKKEKVVVEQTTKPKVSKMSDIKPKPKQVVVPKKEVVEDDSSMYSKSNDGLYGSDDDKWN